MSSTTPSATRNSASLVRLQVEKGRPWSTGRLRAIFLISRRSGRVNVGGRPPEYLGTRESKPSSLKLWMTARTRSADVKATLAIWATSIPWADSSTIWALRHRTTDPEDRRTIWKQAFALLVGDLSNTYAVAHVTSSVSEDQILRDMEVRVVDATLQCLQSEH